MNIEGMQSSAKRYVVSYHRFMKNFAKCKSALFCFFEGEDAKYYASRLEHSLAPENSYFYPCGGKSSVLTILSLIVNSDTYSKAWTCFFIDRDFDDIDEYNGIEKLYVTPCYSIENLYVTQSAFIRMVKSEFNSQNNKEDDLEAILGEVYASMMLKMLNSLDQLNWWLKAQRLAEKAIGSVKLDVSNLDVTKMVHIDLTEIRVNYCYQELAIRCENSHILSRDDIRYAKAWFAGKSKQENYRGKWVFSLYLKFVNKVIQDVCSRNPQLLKSKISVKLKLSGNSLSELSQYADTPECLKRYISIIKNTRYYM